MKSGVKMESPPNFQCRNNKNILFGLTKNLICLSGRNNVFYDKYIIQLEQIQYPLETNTTSSNKKYNIQLEKYNIYLGPIQYPVMINTTSS